jgi:hypothetical protein
MKQLFFVFLFLAPFCSRAQHKPTMTKLYGELGGGVATGNGTVGEGGVRVVLSNNWTYGFSGINIGAKPKNLPSDYVRGFTLLIFIPILDEEPDVDMNLYSVTAGRFFPVSRRLWVTTDAGLSLGTAKEFQFRPNNNRGGLLTFPSNYTYTESRKTTIGALLKAEVNLAFLNFAGLSAGVFTTVNGIQSSVGGSFKLIVGKLNVRERKS